MKPTQEQVIAWAREAGGVGDLQWKGTNILRLAALAYEAGRKDENEACAELCADVGKEYNNEINKKLGLGYELQEVAFDCESAIRARMETNNAEWNEYRGREQ